MRGGYAYGNFKLSGKILTFPSEERLQDMTFEEKRNLLHAVFNGYDEDGIPFGVYIERMERNIYEYYIYAELFCGVRFLHKDDFDYDYPETREEIKDALKFGQDFVIKLKPNQIRPASKKKLKNYKTKIRSIYLRGNLPGGGFLPD